MQAGKTNSRFQIVPVRADLPNDQSQIPELILCALRRDNEFFGIRKAGKIAFGDEFALIRKKNVNLCHPGTLFVDSIGA
jgi:hypothetical protein